VREISLEEFLTLLQQGLPEDDHIAIQQATFGVTTRIAGDVLNHLHYQGNLEVRECGDAYLFTADEPITCAQREPALRFSYDIPKAAMLASGGGPRIAQLQRGDVEITLHLGHISSRVQPELRIFY